MRAVVTVVAIGAVLSSCGFARRHPRVTTVALVSAAAMVVIGGPLEHECTPEPDRACGPGRAATIYGVSGAVGGVVGYWAYGKAAEGDAPPARDDVIAGAGTVIRTASAEDGPRWKACAAARLALTARLESACRHGVSDHTLLDAPCDCDGAGARFRCEVTAAASCRDLAAHPMITATEWSNVASLAAERARARVTARCAQVEGRLRFVDEVCGCDDPDAGETGWCGCVASALCFEPHLDGADRR